MSDERVNVDAGELLALLFDLEGGRDAEADLIHELRQQAPDTWASWAAAQRQGAVCEVVIELLAFNHLGVVGDPRDWDSPSGRALTGRERALVLSATPDEWDIATDRWEQAARSS
jgi:hypothetical protein